ncbi:MAG: porin family protein [Sulfurovum sp.]|nr:porin family protein [Sulfurovum sp.]
MKKLTLSLTTFLAMSTFAIAGGDIAPIEPAIEIIEQPMIISEPSIVVEDQTGFYMGLGYSFLSIDRTIDQYGTDNTYNEGTGDYNQIMFQAGYKINNYLAIEGRYWAGLDEESWATISDNRIQSVGSIDSYGIYAKPMYPITEAMDVYALLGYASSEYDITNDYSGSFDGFSWAVGTTYEFANHLALFADYTVQYNDTEATSISYLDDTIEIITVGLGYNF